MDMQPIINWQALASINTPPRPPVRPENGVNMWDLESDRYNKMSALERELTLNQINAIPLSPEDTVIDLGCGCGRVSIPIARRVKSVTAMDSSRKMLDNCIANAREAGCDNVNPLFLDFFEAEAGKNVPVHDIAVCSRSAALGDLKKLSSFAGKYAVLIIFANAPSIPELLSRVFDNTSSNSKPFRGAPRDRRVGYNTLWNTVYDLGYEPNSTVVEDGFKAVYTSIEEACNDLRVLGTVDEDREEIYRNNIMKFMTRQENGTYEFFLKTRSVVIWWDTHPEKF